MLRLNNLTTKKRIYKNNNGFRIYMNFVFQFLVITERKTNVIKRLWRRLKGNKPQKKQTVNRETVDEVVKSEKVEQKWYHKLSWCGNNKNTDTENKVKEDWELAVTGECDYSKGDAFQVNSSETLIIGKVISLSILGNYKVIDVVV